LFEVQFAVKQGDPQDWGGSWNPPGAELGWIDSFSWPNEITQQGYDYGNPALWSSYQSGDKRKLLTIVGPGDSLVSPGIIAKWGGIKGYERTKLRDQIKNKFCSQNNIDLLRISYKDDVVDRLDNFFV
jgi:hypothetical protein